MGCAVACYGRARHAKRRPSQWTAEKQLLWEKEEDCARYVHNNCLFYHVQKLLVTWLSILELRGAASWVARVSVVKYREPQITAARESNQITLE
jgi:hypothetical protein